MAVRCAPSGKVEDVPHAGKGKVHDGSSVPGADGSRQQWTACSETRPVGVVDAHWQTPAAIFETMGAAHAGRHSARPPGPSSVTLILWRADDRRIIGLVDEDATDSTPMRRIPTSAKAPGGAG